MSELACMQKKTTENTSKAFLFNLYLGNDNKL